MAWPLPQPGEISDRLSTGFETEFRDIAAPNLVDARSARSPLAAMARTQAGGAFGLYKHQAAIAQELFPDTARSELARHGDIWGVPQRQATPSGGNVIFAGVDGTPVPSGASFQLGDVSIVTTAGGVIAGGTLTVPAVSNVGGAAGNFPAGTILPLVAPIGGLSTQSATVEAPGFTGGFDDEDLEDWRYRILLRIRTGAFYGQIGGYQGLALAVPGVAFAKEYQAWVGLGTIGVVVLMGTRAAPRVPTGPELATVQAALDAVRNVTAGAFAVAGQLLTVPVTLLIKPDTVAVRAAVTSAYALFLTNEPGIGGTVERSRLSEAISSAAGEYAHRLDVPSANVVPTRVQLPIPGAITWAAS